MSFLKIFTIFGIIGDWYKRAMADGQVTLAEGAQLLIELADVIGLTVAPEVTALVAEVAKGDLEGQEAVVAEGPEADEEMPTDND